ncbi:TPA: phosphate ABC transporter permease PstA [Candidatus Poribacteria bacterium]|nr:phosphate ABC transporter permease PstA [Candidatus Poribacteria bacterium]HEX30308.1 phosphate ABC transporter permease PstA [Candidatus Poribacteria bacterium]
MLTIGFTLFLGFYLVSHGIGVLSWQFLTRPPREGMKEGGIFPCIIGTLYLALISFLFSAPVGVGAGIYLSEYAADNLLTRLIRSSIRSLAGIPSVVYGLFGVAVFVELFNFGPSVLASGLTLGLMNLPWIITASEEAIRSVPSSFREGALALGATRWEAIWHNVLPYSLTGIVTGVLLAMARAIGEVAPILFTGVTFYLRHLPRSPLEKFMALPYHLFVLSTQHEDIEAVRPIAFGTALVLLLMVLSLDMVAFYLRARYVKIKRW